MVGVWSPLVVRCLELFPLFGVIVGGPLFGVIVGRCLDCWWSVVWSDLW